MDIAARRYVDLAGERIRLSLQAELRKLRIPIVSPAIYAAHKREMVHEYRTGIYVLLGPILYALSSLHFFLRKHQTLARWTPLLCTLLIIGSAAAAVAASMFGYDVLPFVLLFFATAVPSIVFWIYCELASTFGSGYISICPFEFQAATFIWERHSIDPNDKSQLSYFAVPEHLHAQARRASLIDGVQIEVERFYTDPLLFAVRKHLFSTERICIGGWDTGKPAIDNAR